MDSNNYYSPYDIGKIRDKIRDIRDDINRICETAMDGFNDSVWAEYKRRCAEFDAERALRKAMNTHSMEPCLAMDDVIVISAELTCPTMAEVVPQDGVVADYNVSNDVGSHDMHFMEVDIIGEEFKIAESTHVVEMGHSHRSDFVDVHVEEEYSDFLSSSTCSSPISSTLQVLHAPSLESDTGLLDTRHSAPVFHTDVLALVDMAGQPRDIQAVHIFKDRFMVHFHPIVYVIADFFEATVHLCKQLLNDLFSSTCFLVAHHYEGLLVYVRPRLLFDPGGFEDESFRTGRE